MITKVVAVPYITMKERHKLLLEQNAVIISITGTEDIPIFDAINENILPVVFDDINPVPLLKLASCSEMKVMDINQANSIIDFIYKWHKVDTKYTLVVNCMAGICRSGAVVSFAHLICNTDPVLFVENNPNILPNDWVLNLLCYQYFEREKNGNFD